MWRNIGKVTSFFVTPKPSLDGDNRQDCLLQVDPGSKLEVAPIEQRKPWALNLGRGIWFGGFGETVRRGVGSRLSPVSGVGLIEDVAYVMVHGPRADEQLVTDLPVGFSGGNETEHFHFA